MQSPLISFSRRLRATPFTPRVEAAGARAWTIYNHMRLPTVFESPEADYRHLKSHVQVWDVSCERQVEIRGPQAQDLLQMLTPRDVSRMRDDQCFYVPVVDAAGGMLNDPVTLRPGPDRFWVSLADSDLALWAGGLAAGGGLDCDVSEPDVFPLAVQGPKAEALMARVFGDAVYDIRFFRFRHLPFADTRMVVARSGYSGQGGFEIYVEGAEYALPLWDALFAAGADLEVRAGGPNLIERVESGLLSYGNDMTREDTPFHCGLDRFMDLDRAHGCVGREALLRVRDSGVDRRIRGLRLDGAPVPPCTQPWPVFAGGRRVGQVTSAAFSPDFGASLCIAMVATGACTPGSEVSVHSEDGESRTGRTTTLPFRH